MPVMADPGIQGTGPDALPCRTCLVGARAGYPGRRMVVPDGRHLLLPIRVLPGDGARAVASLITNQASFRVLDAITEQAQLAVRYRPGSRRDVGDTSGRSRSSSPVPDDRRATPARRSAT